MRLRLLRRRLTISAPRVAIRSALPWPLRWLALAVVLGLCAAVAVWAFEFGKSIAGVDTVSQHDVLQLRHERAQLHEERAEQQAVVATAQSLLVAEKAINEGLRLQVRQLEADNQSLRENLGFFERLIPAAASGGLAIRGLQGELLGDGHLRWRVLVIQAARNAPEFSGRVEVSLAGLKDGEPWSLQPPREGKPLQFKQYRRLEGVIQVPANAVVKTITARVLDGGAVRATQTVSLP